jgi:hypothetical protein
LAKLIGIQVFDDGITFHVSYRVKSPMFKLDPGWSEAVAATVNALSTGEA